jgi:hypothetical protein
MFIFNGCVGVNDRQGWNSSQKGEFLHILQNDKYLSICDKQALYQEIKETKNSHKMSEMLLSYVHNLANSCIDLKGFENIQRQRKANGFETFYGTYLQEVNGNNIILQLKSGRSIEAILSPYVPKNEQFAKLSNAYKIFSASKTLSTAKLKKLRVNIERIKIMNDDLGEDYILVNIPEFMVRVKHGEKTTLKFKIVVGQRNLQTPIFAERLKYVTLNPQWSVPDSIARNEIIPAILKDPSYITRHRLVIRKTYDLDSPVLNPSREELQSYRGGKGLVPFKFIEVPSRYNALGRVKFIFPNDHSVYMHDTQMKKLFARSVRCFSHGCVRLEKPNDLLSYVTSNYSDKSIAEVNTWYKSMKTHYLKLNKKVMVHTAYMTAYVRGDGNLEMFADVYSFDKYQRLTF